MRHERQSYVPEFERFEARVSERFANTPPYVEYLPQEVYGNQIRELLRADFKNLKRFDSSHFRFKIDGFEAISVQRVNQDPQNDVSIHNIWVSPGNRVRIGLELLDEKDAKKGVDLRKIPLEDNMVNFEQGNFLHSLAAERVISLLQHELLKRVVEESGERQELLDIKDPDRVAKYFFQACRENPVAMQNARITLGLIENRAKVADTLRREKTIDAKGAFTLRFTSLPRSPKLKSVDDYTPRKLMLKDGFRLEFNDPLHRMDLVFQR